MTARRLVPLLALVIALVPLHTACSKKGSGTAAETPDAAVEQITRGLADYQPQVLWQALPPSYQKEVTELLHESAAKMDAELWNETFGIMQKLAQVLREKKGFILANPMVASQMGDKSEVDAGWDAFVGVFEVLLKSELADLNELQKVDVEDFLAGTGSKLMRQIGDAASLAPEDKWQKGMKNLRKAKATVASQKGDAARVKVVIPGEQEREEDWVRVEGYWIPKEMADGWSKSMRDWRKKIDQLSTEQLVSNKQATLMQLGMANGVLDQLLKAKTAEEFNAGLGPIMGLAMGAAMAQSSQMGSMGSSSQPSPVNMTPSPDSVSGSDQGVPVADNSSNRAQYELTNDNPAGEVVKNEKLMTADAFSQVDLHGIVPVDQAGNHIGKAMKVVTREGADGKFRLMAVDGSRLTFERSFVSGTVTVEYESDEIETLELIQKR